MRPCGRHDSFRAISVRNAGAIALRNNRELTRLKVPKERKFFSGVSFKVTVDLRNMFFNSI